MPKKPAHRCRAHGCAELVRGEHWCPAHIKDINAKRNAGRVEYGQRWNKLSKDYRARNPICVKCGRPAQLVDHKIPIAHGGDMYDEQNLQALCHTCHNKKTRHERNAEERADRISNKQAPVAQRATVVCGPPGAGKSRYVSANRVHGDLVIDLDAIMVAISGEPIYQTPGGLLPAGDVVRDELMLFAGNPIRSAGVRHTWAIVSGATRAQRDYYARALMARVVMILPSELICIQRLRNDERRAVNFTQWEELARKWYRNYIPGGEDLILDN